MKKFLSLVVLVCMFLNLTAFAESTGDGVMLSDDASDFVLLSEAVPDAILEIRYYSTYNFVGDRIDGYEEPLAFLTKEAAAALREVSDELVQKGYRLKIFDAYRPQMAVSHFMRWAMDFEDTRMKAYFYPELEKDVLFPLGYIAEHSGHSRGSTVDLTLFDMAAEKEVDMGGTFDYFGELSHPDYMGITEEQYANRMILREAMIAHGFRPLPEEWWHFTLENEPYPDTYYTFSISSKSLAGERAGIKTPREIIGLDAEPSPDWVVALAKKQEAEQLFVAAAQGQTTAWVSLHEKDETGAWIMTMSTPGYIGKNGLGKTREGDGMTPVGVFSFNRAFGIAADPGCAIPYVQADENTYWSGDGREGMRYNELVSLTDYPDLNLPDSEHILDYTYQYQYCLNISYNAEGTPGLGSAIFLHCTGDRNPYTGGCVAIPMAQMYYVMQHVSPDCVVVIDALENLKAASDDNHEAAPPEEDESETNGDVQYVLYLGTNDKDTNKPVFTQAEALENAKEILIRHFGGYTIQEAHGGWIDGDTEFQEYTLVICLSDTSLEQVHAAADEMIEVFHQSSVLIQANPTRTEFYSPLN